MIGSICGDIVGSVYEFNNIKTMDFELFNEKSRFTDDTVMTVAVMDALLNDMDFAVSYKKWFKKYPNAGYGPSFAMWCMSDTKESYNSWGNGSAMRVSPVGFWYDTLEDVLKFAGKSAEVTHSHPEGIKGARAAASAVYLARKGSSKEDIRQYIENTFNYDLSESVDSIRSWYKFDVSCQGSVPQAIICFLESEGFEDAVRKAVSIGGDSDTIACIAGGMAEAYFGVPQNIKEQVIKRLPQDMADVVSAFYRKIGQK